MSTPPSECDGERGSNDRESNRRESNKKEKKDSDARHTKHHAAPHPEMGEAPSWMRARPREPFVGDAAAVRLRNRLAQEDDQPGDQVPLPPSADSSPSIRKGHIVGAMTIVIAAAAVGYLWRSSPPAPLIPEFPAADALGHDQADTRSRAGGAPSALGQRGATSTSRTAGADCCLGPRCRNKRLRCHYRAGARLGR